jgi:hypothetical protein
MYFSTEKNELGCNLGEVFHKRTWSRCCQAKLNSRRLDKCLGMQHATHIMQLTSFGEQRCCRGFELSRRPEFESTRGCGAAFFDEILLLNN